MTCAFCVYGLHKKLEQLPGVERAEVSLEHNRVRIYTRTAPDLAVYQDTIRRAGFTPGDVSLSIDRESR